MSLYAFIIYGNRPYRFNEFVLYENFSISFACIHKHNIHTFVIYESAVHSECCENSREGEKMGEELGKEDGGRGGEGEGWIKQNHIQLVITEKWRSFMISFTLVPYAASLSFSFSLSLSHTRTHIPHSRMGLNVTYCNDYVTTQHTHTHVQNYTSDW